MRKIVNKTGRPLRVKLAGGKVLHLGPRNEGQISDHDVERRGVQEMVKAGEIELLGEGPHAGSGARAGNARNEDTHGHHPDTSRQRRGDR